MPVTCHFGQKEGENHVYPASGKAGSIDTQVTISSLHTLKFFPGTYPSAYLDNGPDGIILRVVKGNHIHVDPNSRLSEGEDAVIAETASSGPGVLYTGNQVTSIGISLKGSRVEK